MTSLTDNVFGLIFVVGIVCGIKLMSSPETAVRGNMLGALCLLGSIVLTLTGRGLVGQGILWVAMAVGACIGALLAMKATMIRMPELVALFNGLGGGASALVGLVLLLGKHGKAGAMYGVTGGLALAIGGITLGGSLIAVGKLARKLPQRPVFIKGYTTLCAAVLSALCVLVVLAASLPAGSAVAVSALALLAALVFGALFAIRVGGADMPITISLLNSLSGLAAAVAGFALRNPLLVAVGATVGAAGLFLTRTMCRAMNRRLLEVIGGTNVFLAEGQVESSIGRQVVEAKSVNSSEGLDKGACVTSILREAENVVIVPGYGMALAQAQEEVKQLLDVLEAQQKAVKFAIHPVAGRMPGHMNVLLAEVDVPYELLCEMDAVNPEFEQTDAVVVVGANDVVNPAAATAEGTPIYGMPILEAGKAKHVIVCNLDDKPGYSGVDNTLYGQDNVVLFLGDAKETLRELIGRLAAADPSQGRHECRQDRT